jgi:hypothetical protein
MPLKDYNNFIEYVRGKSVAIVGPAQLDFTFGKEIDNHDIVVRINRYKERR